MYLKQNLEKILKELPLNKSLGPDLITYEVLKEFSGDKNLKFLIKLIKKLLTLNIPENLKNVKLILIFKKGDAKKPENYRPIALDNSFFKTN